MLLLAGTQAASTVPWWGTGVFTLAGGLVGAIVTGSFALLNTRHKAELDQREAHQRMRRDAAIELLAAGVDHVDSDRPLNLTTNRLIVALTNGRLIAPEVEDEMISYYSAAAEARKSPTDANTRQLIDMQKRLLEALRDKTDIGLPRATQT